MPRVAMHWFRYYSEALTSPKVQRLKPPLFKHWINLMALANISEPRGRLPCLSDVAFALRVAESVAHNAITELVALHFIDVEGDRFVMHDWDEWQADRDVTARKRHSYVTATSLEGHARSESGGEGEIGGEESGVDKTPPVAPQRGARKGRNRNGAFAGQSALERALSGDSG